MVSPVSGCNQVFFLHTSRQPLNSTDLATPSMLYAYWLTRMRLTEVLNDCVLKFNKEWQDFFRFLNRTKTVRTVTYNYRSVVLSRNLNSSPSHNDSSPHLCFQITCKWFNTSFSTCAVKQQRGATALPQMALLTDPSCLTTDLQLYGVITSRWESELETVIIPQMEAETPPVPIPDIHYMFSFVSSTNFPGGFLEYFAVTHSAFCVVAGTFGRGFYNLFCKNKTHKFKCSFQPTAAP